MSLPRKEVRPMILPDLHEQLAIIAEYRDVQLSELAARLLEKSIVAEWHEVSVLIERSERLGKRWKVSEGKS